jgi:hypothetical protein
LRCDIVLFTCEKSDFPFKLEILDAKICMADRMVKFLAKNDRHDLKLGCIDASRRQLQSVLKIGV